MKASEARAISDAAKAEKDKIAADKQLKQYLKSIEDHAKSGLYTVAAGSLYSLTIASLKELGYKVVSVDDDGRSMCSYDWEIKW